VCRDTLCGYSGWCAISVDIIWEGGNHCNHCGTCVDACPAEKGARL
jgi:ferredoxin